MANISVENRLKTLQWGHRLSAMEIAFEKVEGIRHCLASMGPPPFGDGDGISSACGSGVMYGASMGPPPFGDGDSRRRNHARQRAVLLQWGHRLSAMEIAVDATTLASELSRFNGATAFRRWR